MAAEDFKVVVVPSDRYGIDPRPLTSSEPHNEDQWHDCATDLTYNDEEFPALDALQFFRLESGSDKSGSRLFRIVGKYFPAPVIGGEWLKKYIIYKISTELPEGPFSIVYMHSTVNTEYNNPGITILRWIYEELPSDFKDRLQVLYFVHPGLSSRLLIATLGRFLLSGGLYWKVKYVSRLQYLWHDMKKGSIEIPDFVAEHDEVLEKRPLTTRPTPLHWASFQQFHLWEGYLIKSFWKECRPMARALSDALADKVDHAVAMAFGENRGSKYVSIQCVDSTRV